MIFQFNDEEYPFVKVGDEWVGGQKFHRMFVEGYLRKSGAEQRRFWEQVRKNSTPEDYRWLRKEFKREIKEILNERRGV